MQKFGGISRYFYELIRTLPPEVSYKLPLIVSNNHYIKNKDIAEHCQLFNNNSFRGQYRAMQTINQIYSIGKLIQKEYDIFHPTYYSPYFMKYLGDKPYVITCYDLIDERFASENPMRKFDSEKFDIRKKLLKNATKVIAISKNTKSDIIEIYKIPENKIKVIYLASSFTMKNQEALIPDDYILFVGSRLFYKNFIFFLRAIADSLIKNPKIKLICAGGGKFTNDEYEVINHFNLSQQVLQVAANDEEISNLYSHAMFFVFPSLYEGFGIPILESFACGCPAVLSNKSSLPELGGDAAIYFDPNNRDSIADAVNRALSSEELRKQMKHKGFIQQKKFSWNKTVEETINLYRSI